MIALTAYNVASYLMNRRLIKGSDFDEHWTFIESPFSESLNTTVAAFHSSGEKQSFFIKQPRGFQPHVDNLQFEEDILKIIKNTAAGDLVSDFVYIKDTESKDNPLGVKTRRIKYDSANRVLILKFLKDSQPFISYVTSLNRWDEIDKRVDASRAMGFSLAILHKSTERKDIIATRNNLLAIDPGISEIHEFKPWVLAITEREIERFSRSENLFVERLGSFLNANRKLLRELGDQWNENKSWHLLNIDSKLSNIIVAAPNKFVFVDWEYSAYAPSLWQVGGIVANFLSFLGDENPPISSTEVWVNIEYFLMGYLGQDELKFNKQIEIIFLYAGLTLLQQFYSWATNDFPSGDSGNPDKLTIARDCLHKTKTVWNNKVIPGLYPQEP